jgi:23S rRNA (guanosine2251-2'-O)-methyltransferase
MKNNNQQLIFGTHACIAALSNTNRVVYKIMCTEQVFIKYKNLIEKKNIKEVSIKKRNQIDSSLGLNTHQGFVIYCNPLIKINSLEKIEKENIVLILDSLTDSQNVGSIIRTAFLFGVKTILYTKYNSFEINPYLIKSASGAFEEIQLIEVINLNQTIEILKKKEFWIVGLDTNSKKRISTIPKDVKLAIVLGSENKGIKKLSLEKCDFRVNINTVNSELVDSLNVSHATAIVLYEVNNERTT